MVRPCPLLAAMPSWRLLRFAHSSLQHSTRRVLRSWSWQLFGSSRAHRMTSPRVARCAAKILVCLRDGKTLIGELQSFDQFGNLVLSHTVERIIVNKLYADKSVGTFILRGENIVLLGEIDPAKESAGGLRSVSEAEIEKERKAAGASAQVDWSFLLDD